MLFQSVLCCAISFYMLLSTVFFLCHDIINFRYLGANVQNIFFFG